MLDDIFMDPKMPSNLDPKLKEAYERVMGTTIPKPSAPPTPTATPMPNPIPGSSQALPAQPRPEMPSPVPPSPQSSETMVKVSPTPTAFVAKPQKAKSGGISPTIIFLGLFVFFVVYSLFWLKFFNVSIPFLPQ